MYSSVATLHMIRFSCVCVRERTSLPLDMDAVSAILAASRNVRGAESPKLKDKHVQRLRALRQRLKALKQLRTWPVPGPTEGNNTNSDHGIVGGSGGGAHQVEGSGNRIHTVDRSRENSSIEETDNASIEEEAEISDNNDVTAPREQLLDDRLAGGFAKINSEDSSVEAPGTHSQHHSVPSAREDTSSASRQSGDMEASGGIVRQAGHDQVTALHHDPDRNRGELSNSSTNNDNINNSNKNINDHNSYNQDGVALDPNGDNRLSTSGRRHEGLGGGEDPGKTVEPETNASDAREIDRHRHRPREPPSPSRSPSSAALDPAEDRVSEAAEDLSPADGTRRPKSGGDAPRPVEVTDSSSSSARSRREGTDSRGPAGRTAGDETGDLEKDGRIAEDEAGGGDNGNLSAGKNGEGLGGVCGGARVDNGSARTGDGVRGGYSLEPAGSASTKDVAVRAAGDLGGDGFSNNGSSSGGGERLGGGVERAGDGTDDTNRSSSSEKNNGDGGGHRVAAGRNGTHGVSTHHQGYLHGSSGGGDTLAQGGNLGAARVNHAATPAPQNVEFDEQVRAEDHRHPGGAAAAPATNRRQSGDPPGGAFGRDERGGDTALQTPQDAINRWASPMSGGVPGEDGILVVKAKEDSLDGDESSTVSSISGGGQWRPLSAKSAKERTTRLLAREHGESGGAGCVRGGDQGRRGKASSGAGAEGGSDCVSSGGGGKYASRRQVRVPESVVSENGCEVHGSVFKRRQRSVSASLLEKLR